MVCALPEGVWAMIPSCICLLRPLVYDGAITMDGGSGQGAFGCNDQNAM